MSVLGSKVLLLPNMLRILIDVLIWMILMWMLLFRSKVEQKY